MGEILRIGSMIIFHLSKLWKAKFFILFWWGCSGNLILITLGSNRVLFPFQASQRAPCPLMTTTWTANCCWGLTSTLLPIEMLSDDRRTTGVLEVYRSEAWQIANIGFHVVEWTWATPIEVPRTLEGVERFQTSIRAIDVNASVPRRCPPTQTHSPPGTGPQNKQRHKSLHSM